MRVEKNKRRRLRQVDWMIARDLDYNEAVSARLGTGSCDVEICQISGLVDA